MPPRRRPVGPGGTRSQWVEWTHQARQCFSSRRGESGHRAARRDEGPGMRLILPLIAFAVAALFDWALSADGGALIVTRSAAAQHDIELFCGVFFWLSGAWLATAALAMLIRHWAAGPGAQSSLPRLLIDVGAIIIFGATL